MQINSNKNSASKSVVSKVTFLSLGFCTLAISSGCRDRVYSAGSDVSAAFVSNAARGRVTVPYTSPAGVREQCIAVKHFPGVEYDDDDLGDENELCKLDFYKIPGASGEATPVALCPKMSSTFPGVEIYELDGQDKTKYETALCKGQDNRPTSRIAKFKQSVSCCYTGSVLAYYHISRILGGALNVPVAVIRTMDVSQHAAIAKRGAAWSSSLNQKLWNQVLGYDTAISKRDNYFSADSKTVFGAMSMNPKGEERYAEINQNSADPATARLNFLAKPQVQRVFQSGSVGTVAPRDLPGSAQILQQMKDISDLVVVDHIMQQQDRFGNIHYQNYYYYLNPNGKIEKKRVKQQPNGAMDPKPTPDAVLVKRMLLKDNDCGSRAGNPKAFTLDEVKKLRHMNPRTYKGIRYLAQTWRAGVAKPFFQSESLLNTPDVLAHEGLEDFGARLLRVADVLYTNCKSGTLMLDLDLGDHIKGLNSPELVAKKCEDVLSPTPSIAQPAQFIAKGCKVQSPDGATDVRKEAIVNGAIYMSLNNGASVRAVAENGGWYSVEYRLNQMDHGLRFGKPAWIQKSHLACP
jgi:hypothetical protein